MKKMTFGVLVVLLCVAFGISAQAQPRIGDYDSRDGDFVVRKWSETLWGGSEGAEGNEIAAFSKGYYNFYGATLKKVTLAKDTDDFTKYVTIYKGGTLVVYNLPEAPWYNPTDAASGIDEYVMTGVKARNVTWKFKGEDEGKIKFELSFDGWLDDYPCFGVAVVAKSKKQEPRVDGTGDLESDLPDPIVISGKLKWATIEILAPVPLPVAVDIKPGSCPNPINVKSNGVLPVAIVNTGYFDIKKIDPTTIELAGVSPLRWSYEDVATPYGNPCDEELEDKCDCSELGPDGFVDLMLHFDTQEVVAALESVCDGEQPNLFITGYLRDGTTLISGRDVVIILNKGKGKDKK